MDAVIRGWVVLVGDEFNMNDTTAWYKTGANTRLSLLIITTLAEMMIIKVGV